MNKNIYYIIIFCILLITIIAILVAYYNIEYYTQEEYCYTTNDKSLTEGYNYSNNVLKLIDFDQFKIDPKSIMEIKKDFSPEVLNIQKGLNTYEGQ